MFSCSLTHTIAFVWHLQNGVSAFEGFPVLENATGVNFFSNCFVPFNLAQRCMLSIMGFQSLRRVLAEVYLFTNAQQWPSFPALEVIGTNFFVSVMPVAGGWDAGVSLDACVAAGGWQRASRGGGVVPRAHVRRRHGAVLQPQQRSRALSGSARLLPTGNDSGHLGSRHCA